MNKSEDGSGPGQGTSAGYEIKDGHRVSPTGNTTKGKHQKEEDRRDVGKTNQTTTGRVPSGRGQRKIGRCGSSGLRPSPNHGTLWLHNDDGDDVYDDDDDDDE